MISLDHSARTIRLTSLDDIICLRVDLKGPLSLAVLAPVLHRPHSDVLQRDDALGNVLGGVLEVIQAPVVQDKPAALPGFPTSTLQKISLLLLRIFNFLKYIFFFQWAEDVPNKSLKGLDLAYNGPTTFL